MGDLLSASVAENRFSPRWHCGRFHSHSGWNGADNNNGNNNNNKLQKESIKKAPASLMCGRLDSHWPAAEADKHILEDGWRWHAIGLVMETFVCLLVGGSPSQLPSAGQLPGSHGRQ